MFYITVAPLSAPELMTEAAKAAIRSAERLFLQTAQHPYARFVLDERLRYTAMDDLYEAAADFTGLNAQIAARLAEAGDCVYAVTGSIAATQLPAIRHAAETAGGEVRVLAGVPAAFAAFPGRQIDLILAASRLPEQLPADMSIVIEEVCGSLLAGNVKLLLSEYYPDDWKILVSDVGGDGFQSRTIPLYTLDRLARYHATTTVYVPAASFERRVRYGFDDLRAVLLRLRAPGGCPWDREQTHETLKEPLIEECYELIDAIESGDDMNMCEELGDVLMQVVFHAAIAAEQGRFTERDITTGVVQKLVYRHPHVFGSVRADSADEVLANWDKLKMTEKHRQTQTDVLKSVPRCFPALMRARKVQKKAANVGFDWPDAQAAFPKIAEEADELRRAMAGGGKVEEEAGDLLFAVVNVARLLGLDPEALLRDATDKFIARFASMEAAAAASGKELENIPFLELDELWKQSKMTRKV